MFNCRIKHSKILKVSKIVFSSLLNRSIDFLKKIKNKNLSLFDFFLPKHFIIYKEKCHTGHPLTFLNGNANKLLNQNES